jgi:hypothetical protein
MKYLKMYEDYKDDKIICYYCDDVLNPDEENKTWEKFGSKQKAVCNECIKDYVERRGKRPVLENNHNKCEFCEDSIIEGKYCEDCRDILNNK